MAWIRMRDGHRLHVRTVGSGKPVMLIHGYGSNSSHWLPNVLPYRKQYSFILPDLRGFGRSHNVPITGDDVFGLYADDIADIFEHYGLTDTALGGISTGAYACLNYNKKYGFERVSKYLNIEHAANSLNCPGKSNGLFRERQDEIFSRFSRLLALANAAGESTPYWDLPAETRAELRATMTGLIGRAINNRPARTTVRVVGPRTERLLAGRLFPIERWYSYMQVMQAFMAGSDTTPALANIRVPVTLMVGMHSRFFTPDSQFEMQHKIPHADIVRFTRAGHIPMLEQPIRFQREFKRWLFADPVNQGMSTTVQKLAS